MRDVQGTVEPKGRWGVVREALHRIAAQEDINFLLTNRIPRHALTRLVGWISQIRHPWVRDLSIAAWRAFADLDLSEARKTRFESLHDCFIRELRPGARPVDPDLQVFASPCDAIVGAHGRIVDGQVFQAKGFPYSMEDLIGPIDWRSHWREGSFVTLRITSAMYHRFHAPCDARLRRVRYFHGDTWNVNPIVLKRVERLFCRNERAFLQLDIAGGQHVVALVPVAAILVASIRLHALDTVFYSRYRGPTDVELDQPLARGEEMGWFQHGSTILVFAPPAFEFAPGLCEGMTIRMGEALMRMP